MVTTLYLVRHGETEGAEIKRYKGSLDVPMSEKGAEQIKKAAAFIFEMEKQRKGSDSRLSRVYSSPLSRALRSAEIIAEPYGLKPAIVSDLQERHFGIWEGMSYDEIREKHPEEFRAWADNPLKHSPVGGESTMEVKERVIRALERILAVHGTQESEGRESMAIVAHGGVNRIILCHVMGIPLENIFRIEQDCGAVNIIEFWSRYPVVKLLNGGVLK